MGKLFAGTDDGRVWMTEDDGGSWNELTDRFQGVPAGTYVSRIKASSHDVNRVYVTFDNHRTNDFTPYVFVSDDNGASFRSISVNLPTGKPDFVHVIEEDPVNPHLLFVGTDVGAYVSTDRGEYWQRFMHGLPTVPVHDLEVHPRDKELVAGTHGRSIWVVGIAALQGLTDAVVADGGLLSPAPAHGFANRARGGESTGQQYWARPTPGSGAVIPYYLSEELVKEARAQADAKRTDDEDEGPAARLRSRMLEIKITDENDEPVQTLSASLTAGLSRTTWNMRGTAEVEEREPSPYERVEREKLTERAEHLKDSLVAEEWDEDELDRVLGMLTGSTMASRPSFGGGGGGFNPGDAEEFQERPGESPPGRATGRGGAGGNFGRMREIASLLMPGASMGAVMSRFRGRGGGGGSGRAPLVESGTYTLTVEVAGRTFTSQIKVNRVPDNE